jgi:hypothetical protein
MSRAVNDEFPHDARLLVLAQERADSALAGAQSASARREQSCRSDTRSEMGQPHPLVTSLMQTIVLGSPRRFFQALVALDSKVETPFTVLLRTLRCIHHGGLRNLYWRHRFGGF